MPQDLSSPDLAEASGGLSPRRQLSRWWRDHIRDPLRALRPPAIARHLIGKSPGVPLTVAPEPDLVPRPARPAAPPPGRAFILHEATVNRIRPHPLSALSTQSERRHFERHDQLAEEMRIARLGPHFWFPEQGYAIDPEGGLCPYTVVARFHDPEFMQFEVIQSRKKEDETRPSFYFYPEALAKAPVISGERLIVSHFPTNNYGHFLIDMAPVADFGAKAGLKMISRPLLPWHRDIFGLMGVKPGAVAEFRRECVRLKQPILSNYHNAFPTRAFNVANLEIYRKIARAAAGQGKTGAGLKKIFLCRGDAATRCIANRSQLADELAALGFVAVQAETLSFSDQVAVFADAKSIVAEFGAGLANLLFAPKAELVVEIVPEGQDDPWSVNLCAALGVEHVVLFEKNDRPPPVDGVVDNRFRYEVDIVRLLKTLRQLLSRHA